MSIGKQTCKVLKEIRRQIAAANSIDLVMEECHHQGDCLGTCPKCESEVRYLETQLADRRRRRLPIKLVGVSAALLAGVPAVAQSPMPANPDAEPAAPEPYHLAGAPAYRPDPPLEVTSDSEVEQNEEEEVYLGNEEEEVYTGGVSSPSLKSEQRRDYRKQKKALKQEYKNQLKELKLKYKKRSKGKNGKS